MRDSASRTDEEPLPAAKMAGQGNEGDRLSEPADLNMEQCSDIASHIGADPGASDRLAIGVNPSDFMRTGC
jgi:hypothetical protein